MAPTSPAGKKLHLEWILLLAAGMSMVVWQYHLPGLSMDGVTYLQIVRNLQMGEGLGWQGLWASPGYSLLLALATQLAGSSDLLRVASLVGPVIYLLLLLLVYFFSKQLFGRRTALVAGILAAVSPHLQATIYSPEPELLYTCLLIAGLFMFYTALLRKSPSWAFLAGVGFALAWLTRSEGLLVMMFTLGMLLIFERGNWRDGRIVQICLLTILAFMLTAAPYLFFLRSNYGSLVLSPKATYVQIWMKNGYGDSKKEELHNDELWGLTPAGKLNWQQPKGLGHLIAYLAADPVKTARVYLRNIGNELPGRIPNNSGMEKYPQLFPVYLVLAAVLGAVTSAGQGSGRKKLVLLAPFLILFVLPIFTGGWWKYLLPFLPLLLIMAARGAVAGSDWLTCRYPFNKGPGARFFLPVLTMLVVGRFLWPLSPVFEAAPVTTVSFRQQIANEQKKAGEWAIINFGRGRRYSLPWSKLVYHLNGYWVASPIASYAAQLSYLWRHRADFVVIELKGREIDDELASSLAPLPGMEFAGMYQSSDGEYAAIFLRVLRPDLN